MIDVRLTLEIHIINNHLIMLTFPTKQDNNCFSAENILKAKRILSEYTFGGCRGR